MGDIPIAATCYGAVNMVAPEFTDPTINRRMSP
ncbi:hypothetical protein BH10ACT3_BH10ACT3_04590 [soil metagenome]